MLIFFFFDQQEIVYKKFVKEMPSIIKKLWIVSLKGYSALGLPSLHCAILFSSAWQCTISFLSFSATIFGLKKYYNVGSFAILYFVHITWPVSIIFCFQRSSSSWKISIFMK